MKLSLVLNHQSSELIAGKFGPSQPIYPFTTERLDYAIPLVGGRTGVSATILGSSDAVLGLVLQGVRQIYGIDCNPAAIHWGEFKLRSVERLPYAEFLELSEIFTVGELSISEQEWLTSLVSELDLTASTANFLRQIIAGSSSNKDMSRYVKSPREGVVGIVARNGYLKSAQSYEKVREALRDAQITLVCSELGAFLEGCFGEFDSFYLSNLADYAERFYPESRSPLISFRDQLLSPVINKLGPGGQAVIAYIYDVDSSQGYHAQVDDSKLRQEVFNQIPGYAEVEFEGIAVGTRDKVILARCDG